MFSELEGYFSFLCNPKRKVTGKGFWKKGWCLSGGEVPFIKRSFPRPQVPTIIGSRTFS